ncbi:uncharacterized protein LOC143558531 [Bidens hawaiensis]|uniref:uncharacterized protein LOC143558531 n=1 Tax=Bidens hawaiensis TaxID=980011 RepID=UPI00404A9EB7
MYPAYPWTDSYPNHADTRAKDMMIPFPSSSLYQPWPYAAGYSYHGCCNHACYGYGYRPHYTHYHPYGLHAPFPYHVPPPHYSIEQPRYEDYDKKRNHHCCGCNHQEEDVKTPMIKEESQADKKTTSNNNNNNNNDSSLLLKGRPEGYPIMWVPRDYVTNTKPEAKKMHSHDPVSAKRLEPSKQGGNGEMARDTEYPILWVPRGYMTNTEPEAKEKEKEMHSREPVSVKNIEPSKRGGNGEMAQDEKNGDGNRFPFKIFWLPPKNYEAGNDTKENTHDLVSKNGLPDDKITKNKADSGTEGECETSKKHGVQKVIPVKQASTKEEKKNPKSIETKVNTSSVEKIEDGSRASPKTSRLPPVCLRVDPLPRKKKSSRSPSPTAEKQRSNKSPVNTLKSSQQEAQVFKKSEEEQGEVNIKTVDHANKVERDNVTDNVATGKGDESEKEKKNNMSEDEAALIIQSVYRGFEVRKSQPLKKLRQIYEVKKQVSELRNRIQDLETSSSTDRIDGKKQVIISETIMSLLLKLDTIQGLHPFVREARKSVAKELVGLQERLDSLVKSVTPSDQQIMHPEDEKSDQAQDQTNLCEGHEHEATESQYNDVADACNTASLEQQLEMSTENDAKFDQAPTESDSVICVNQEVESRKDKSDQAPTECDEALELCENQEGEVAESKEGCNTVGEPQLKSYEPKLDQPPTECAEACETHEVETTIASQQVESSNKEPSESNEACETHEVENTVSQELCNTVEKPTECDKQEVGAIESHEGCKPLLESHKEKLTECDEAELCDQEAIESQEGCETTDELQLELHNDKPTEPDDAIVTHAAEATVSQEGCNNIAEPQMESHNEKPTECDNVCATHAAEATASQEGCNNIVEPHMESHEDQTPTECDSHEAETAHESHKDNTNNGVVEADDMKHELSGDAKNISMMEMKSAAKANEGEKVRMAMEELMNEQLNVIRELMGRVKDLEKKLSKKQKKKIKVNKGRRSIVEQEECLV